MVTETTNENNQTTTEFKDKAGRVVCRDVAGLRTYYAYDDLGLLRCIVPPKAASLLINTSFTPFDGGNDLVFAYAYDKRGRLSRKKIPGAGITTFTYDAQDRLITSTDAKNATVVTSYDALDRVVSTSLAGGQMLTQHYYDNYSYSGSKAFDQSHAYAEPNLVTVTGLLTGTKVWGLGLASSQSWLTTTHYDRLGRVIQTRSDNHLGGEDKSSSKLDFVGRLLESKLTTQTSLSSITVETRQSYDRASRLKAVCQRVTDSQSAAPSSPGQYWEPIARHTYNGLGELTQKTLGCSLQKLDYTYLMRGWLDGINQPTNLEQGGDKDFFGMSLVYDGVGNITNWTYRSGQKQGLYAGSNSLSPNPTMAYSFSYDTQNRLKSANLTQNTSTTVFAMGGSDGGKIGYDDNGNILSLNRSLNGTLVDNLSYSYGTNSNRLFRVEDASGNASLFNNLNSGSDDYSYDATGNLIRDANKDIITISYNHLNLPQSVVTASGTVNYTYTASGQKLKASFPGSPAKTYDYAGGLVYEGGKLEFIPTAEGRILPPGRAINPASGTSVIANRYYRYEYQLKDHLGNLRVACRCPEVSTAVTGSQLPGPGDTYPLMVVQEEQYDPWGLSLTGLSSQTMLTANRFKFIGREEQQGLGWIDLQARPYDPQTGRFTGVDPVTENQEDLSTYQYGWNNPVLKSDPDGKCPGCGENDPFLFAKLAVTAFYDTKHAIENTALRLLGSDNRVGYKVVDGQQVFETAVYKKIPDNSVSGITRETANAALDAVAITGLKTGGVTGGLLAKTGSNQTTKAIKETIELRHYTSNKGLEGIQSNMKIKAYDKNTVFAEKAKGKPLSAADAADKYGIKKSSARNYVQFEVESNKVNVIKNAQTGATEYVIKGDVELNEKTKFIKRN